MSDPRLALLALLLLSLLQQTLSWNWFRSSPPPNSIPSLEYSAAGASAAEFSIEALHSQRGLKLVEDAKLKLSVPNACWQNAYRNLFSSCADIASDKEKQSRLAWHLSDCFQRDSGRPGLPYCGSGSSMLKCLEVLNDSEHKIYLQFFLEANSICHQLQMNAFKYETERLVNELKKSSEFTEDKLENLQEKSEVLLRNSDKLQDSFTWIDVQTQQVVKASKDVEAQVHDVLEQSKAIFEQSKGIASAQFDLREGQAEMKEGLVSGMAVLRESYESLGDGIEKLKGEAMKIEGEIIGVRDSMLVKMESLHDKADDIGNVTGTSLEKQRQLLEGQSVALEGIEFLTKFLSKALEESRETLEKLTEFGHKQQEELLRRQEQIEQSHDRLIQNSQSILAAQEEFEAKQSNIFAALDKLYVLHNAILLESRYIKAFVFYSLLIFLLYMLTSAKQTSGARSYLYLGLVVTFLVEFAIVRFGAHNIDNQSLVTSKVFLVRSSFMLVASIQILYSIFTYRDYEKLNHQMLLSLIEKVNAMENYNTGKKMLTMETECDSAWSQFSWIDLEEVDEDEDPDYVLQEGLGENSITSSSVSRKYDLRPRFRSR
ncbi:Protein GAMETE EXPRESSED 1 [Acorus gramineus]|uniref:Protein GAMETE EXPRESSED 1 n=1 Tax=Acorus gramineus TaxID=55184 RepID=A0AAV9AHI9_ACOGR|nr:Protein GAMETE EXPRESSED 1 [Acorus gramineus]